MRIVVVGGGPAGLYFGLLMKKSDPRHQVSVIERNPPDATYGWGVVFSEETLGALRDADRVSYDRITDSFATWGAIDVRFRGERIRSRGHSFSAIARKRLLELLQERCRELGVELRFLAEADPDGLPDGDLVVAADGVNSRLREQHAEVFRTRRHIHGTKYAWYGVELPLEAFTFSFRETEHGLFQAHAYPFDERLATFIVETPVDVWERAGLDRCGEVESLAFCQDLFAEDLRGRPLLSNRSLWMSFVTLANDTWHHGNLVLMGDAAHTAHFTIGSGTKLAMEDAISLAQALEGGRDLEAALTDYAMERQPVVERFQQAALESSAYFEHVGRYTGFEPIQFAFNLLTRSGRIGHLNLQLRDPVYVSAVDRWFAGRASRGGGGGARPGREETLVAPPPVLAPFTVGGLDLPNRVAVEVVSEDAATDGMPGPVHAASLAEAMATGAGLVVTELIAVSPEGRISPGTPGLWDERQAAAWGRIVQDARGGAAAGPAICARLGHAGRRGSTRSRREGADRPLRQDGWEIVAPSPIPYGPSSSTPRELTDGEIVKLLDQFRAAAVHAATAGFDAIELDMAHGHLPASFLSPLANQRSDLWGGSPQNRLRFPLRALAAVRQAWPSDRPLFVRLLASDLARGGFDVDDAVSAARHLRDADCDLIQVEAGQTTFDWRPDYGRFFLVPMSDRIRNEAGVPTLVGGNLTVLDELDTVLAAGRADLCVLEPRRYLGTAWRLPAAG